MDSINPLLLEHDRLDGTSQSLPTCFIQHPGSPKEDTVMSFLESSSLTEHDETISNPEANIQILFQSLDCPVDYFATVEQDAQLNLGESL